MLSFNSTRGFPLIMCTSVRARVRQPKGLHSKIQCSVSGCAMAAYVDQTPTVRCLWSETGQCTEC